MSRLDPDDKLTDLLGSARATLGVIVVGFLFLHSLSTNTAAWTMRGDASPCRRRSAHLIFMNG